MSADPKTACTTASATSAVSIASAISAASAISTVSSSAASTQTISKPIVSYSSYQKQIMTTYSISPERINEITESELQAFEKRFYEKRTEGGWGYDSSYRGYGSGYNYHERTAIVNDNRITAFTLANAHGFKALDNFTKEHFQTMKEHDISGEKMLGVTKEDIAKFPHNFYLYDNQWREIVRGKDKRTLAYKLAKEYGFKRVFALNYYYLEALEDYSLSFEQVEATNFSIILNESAQTKDKLLALLRDRKDLNVKFVSTLSDPSKANQITLLRRYDLSIKLIQDERVLRLFGELSNNLHAGFFERIKRASESELTRILNLTLICIEGLVKYDLPLELVEDPKFTQFINGLPKLEYADKVLPLIKTHGFDKVSVLSPTSLEGMSVLGLSFEQGASPEFQKFSKELGESLYSFEDLKAKGLFTKESFEDFVKFDLKQIDAILNPDLNFNFEQVMDVNFHQFYIVYEDTWYKNLPDAINQVLFSPHHSYPYQRIFRLAKSNENKGGDTGNYSEKNRLCRLADNTASVEELERELCKEDYDFSNEQVNDKSFAEALNQNLNIIAKWARGQNLPYSRRIFALDANQLEALESEVDLSIVENPGFRVFYNKIPKGQRGETCALVKSEGQKIWELSPLQFEARLAHKLETAAVSHQRFESLFKEYYEYRETLVKLIKTHGMLEISKLKSHQFEAIFKHKLDFLKVIHPHFDNFHQNFLKTHAELGLQLLNIFAFEQIFRLTSQQAEGIKTYNLTLTHVEDPNFSIVYSQEERIRKMDFELRKLGLTYLEIKKLTDERKTALLKTGYGRVSRLERSLFLIMVNHDLLIEEVESPEYTAFCEKIKNEILRIFAFKLFNNEKGDRANICKRVFVLNESQLKAMCFHGFTLEQVEKSAATFAKAIKNFAEKATAIIKDTAINRLYRLTFRHFKAMIKFELSLEEVEDPNFIRLYKNFIKTHTEMAISLIKTQGFKNVVALDLEQIQGIKEFGFSFEQVADPAYLTFFKAIKLEKHKKLLFKWVKEGLTYKEAMELYTLYEPEKLLEFIETLLTQVKADSKSKSESETTNAIAAIYKLTIIELPFLKKNNLNYYKFKEFETLKAQLQQLKAKSDENKRTALYECCNKILAIVKFDSEAYQLKLKIDSENKTAANAAKALEKTIKRLQINQPSQTIASVDIKATNDKVPSRTASATAHSRTLNRSPSVKSVVASAVRHNPNSRPISQQTSRPQSARTSTSIKGTNVGRTTKVGVTTGKMVNSARGATLGANAAAKPFTPITPLANMRRTGVGTASAGKMTAAQLSKNAWTSANAKTSATATAATAKSLKGPTASVIATAKKKTTVTQQPL